MLATKCVAQPYDGSGLSELLESCLTLTYNAAAYAEEKGVNNRRGMKEFYRSLKQVSLPSCYKVAAITRACALVKSRMKSRTRGEETKHKNPLRPMVCIISGFFVTMKGRLFIPLRRDDYFDIQLNHHVVQTIDGKKIRSLTITPDSLSFCYSQEVESLPVKTVYGVDRNEKNLTFGDRDGVIQLGMAKAVEIKQTTRKILGSFRRNDVRIRKQLARKYWKRANDRTNSLLHASTNSIIGTAVRNGGALALEDLTDIRMMYRRGNRQGEDYRFRLNSWPHWRAKRMLEYKAKCKGVTIIQLTKSETYGSSSTCSACGEKLHSPGKGDAAHERMLWCQACKTWMDRDVNATLNLSARGLARFASSHHWPKNQSQLAGFGADEKGLVGEAMKGNPTPTAILRVNASKLSDGRGPST